MLEALPVATPEVAPATAERLTWRTLLGLTHLAFAHNFMWTALLVITVPAQVVTIAGERNKTTALAGVLVAGALVAAVTQVIAGGLSDRTFFSFGRRRPFIIIGTAIGLIGLALMGSAHSIAMLALAILVLQFGFNLGQPAYAAVIPDRVPVAQRGVASGLLGLLAMLGVLCAAILSGILVKVGNYGSFTTIYAITLILQSVFTLTTVIVLHEEPALVPDPPFVVGAFLRGLLRDLWLSLRANPDFAWVFITRFLVMMGYWTVLTFLFYYARDQLGRQNAAHAVSLITGAVIIAAAVTIYFGGRISDRVGRKPVVYASAGLMAAISLTFIVTHTVGMAIVVGAIWGLGWGAYQGVDWALATDVLPRPQHAGQLTSFARYMGIWSLAVTLPQVLSPAIGPAITILNDRAHDSGYTFMFVVVFIYFLFGAVLVRYVRGAR